MLILDLFGSDALQYPRVNRSSQRNVEVIRHKLRQVELIWNNRRQGSLA